MRSDAVTSRTAAVSIVAIKIITNIKYTRRLRALFRVTLCMCAFSVCVCNWLENDFQFIWIYIGIDLQLSKSIENVCFRFYNIYYMNMLKCWLEMWSLNFICVFHSCVWVCFFFNTTLRLYCWWHIVVIAVFIKFQSVHIYIL